MSTKQDVVIVGAGVVGLSIAISILDSKPGLKVTVIDKEVKLGAHASGKNSGVLHAGFYYSPDSLKAKFCRDGNFRLKELCRKHSIPILATGKVVVARDESENSRLDNLFDRGTKNGVELALLSSGELKRIEPLAITHERFLWSPNTAVSDPFLVLDAMRKELSDRGGVITLNEKVRLERNELDYSVPGYSAKVVVNAAGAQADRIARKVGLAQEYAMVPFMGVYRAVEEKFLPLRRLVYPVPHPINPFLGVHFTITLNGKIKIGPTAIPIFGREQYSPLSGWSISDMYQAVKASYGLIKGEAHDFSEIVKGELPKLREKSLVKESATLVPDAANVTKWSKRPPGIRSQLVNMVTKELEQDFVIEVSGNSVHVLNSVSPGWTSSIPFGQWIAVNHILPKL